MTHRRTIFLALLFAAVLGAEQVRSEKIDPKPLYLDNGTVRLGVDLSSGGSIFYFAESKTKRNLLNHYDRGRFIQQSYYGDADGSMWNGKPWRWNPVQGGDWRGKRARVLSEKHTDTTLELTSVPVNWAGGQDVADTVMGQSIQLEGPVARIRYTFEYSGPQEHAPRHQELPAVFVDYALPNLVTYVGAEPWTGGALRRSVPGWPNEPHTADERWAAYVDDRDWGLGVFFPDSGTRLTAYRFKGPAGPKGAGCSYFAPVKTMGVTPGLRFEYEVFLTVGRSSDIRERFAEIRSSRPKVGKSKPKP